MVTSDHRFYRVYRAVACHSCTTYTGAEGTFPTDLPTPSTHYREKRSPRAHSESARYASDFDGERRQTQRWQLMHSTSRDGRETVTARPHTICARKYACGLSFA